MRVPDGPGESPAGLPGGCKMMKFQCCCIVFVICFTHLASWLMHLALGGSDVLQTCDVSKRLGRQEGSMRVPGGPGEAPAGLPGGCKMLKIHWLFFWHF